ncbi:MAG: hypothetical protein HY558_02850 [Euryarchaeota archaeon]|nr:hypothetical protein [Euryarchaeota archaeon]
MIPKESLETIGKYAQELLVPPQMLVTEYEKIYRSSHLEKLDESTRHQEALRELRLKFLDQAKIKKFRKGRLG